MRMESFLIGVLATLFACACLNAEDETGYQFGKDKLMYACPSNSSSAERTQQPKKSDDLGKGGQRIQTAALPIGKEVTLYRRPFLGLVAESGGQTKRLSWENAGEYLTKIHDAKQMESLLLLFHDDLKKTRIGIAGISDIYSQVRSQKESRPFISVGAVCQRVFRVCFGAVVLLMLRLKCLVKRKEALRGRNLSRDSQVKGAPMVHPASDVPVASEVVFCAPIGHLCHASKNPNPKPKTACAPSVFSTSSEYHHLPVVARHRGIALPVQRRTSGAARRLDSSLRSHRTQRAHCRCVYSGLNKTLFASVGPNSHGRSHRLAASHMWDSLTRHAGWINASRGLRLDGTPSAEVFPQPQSVTKMPQYAVSSIRSGGLLPPLAGHPSAVGSNIVFRGRSAGVGFFVADHGVKNSQQASAHRYVRLGSADAANEPLADRLLFFVGAAERQRGLAQRPTQAARAGLGDRTRLCATGRFLEVGGQSRPKLQGVGIGKSVERSDLGGNDAAPDFVDAGRAFEQFDRLPKSFGAIGESDLQMQPGALTFDELDDVEVIGERLLLDGLEEMAEGQNPFLGGGAVELRSGDVGGQEHGTHRVLGAGEQAAELMPMTAEFSELHEFVVGDVAQRAFAASESLGDVAGVVGVVLPPFSASIGQFGGVGDVDAIDAGAILVDKPLDEADGLDGQMRGSWLGKQPVLDAIPAFGGDFHAVDQRAVGPHSSKGNGVLMQINANERLISYDCVGHSECLRVRGRKNVHTQRKFSFRRPLHGFTIVDEQIEKPTIERFILDRDGMWLAHFLCVENASVIEYKYVVSDKHKVARLRLAIIRGPENPSGNGEFQAPDEWPAEKQQRWKEFRRCRDYLMSQTIKNKKTEKGNHLNSRDRE